jgi:hypothetical protein
MDDELIVEGNGETYSTVTKPSPGACITRSLAFSFVIDACPGQRGHFPLGAIYLP